MAEDPALIEYDKIRNLRRDYAGSSEINKLKQTMTIEKFLTHFPAEGPRIDHQLVALLPEYWVSLREHMNARRTFDREVIQTTVVVAESRLGSITADISAEVKNGYLYAFYELTVTNNQKSLHDYQLISVIEPGEYRISGKAARDREKFSHPNVLEFIRQIMPGHFTINVNYVALGAGQPMLTVTVATRIEA